MHKNLKSSVALNPSVALKSSVVLNPSVALKSSVVLNPSAVIQDYTKSSYRVDFCDIRATNNYKTFVNELENQYGFEPIGEGGFGVVMGYKSCAIKIIKDLKRCEELKHEKSIYERINVHYNPKLIGKIPKYNLYEEFDNFCHFNMERIYAPLSEYDDGVSDKVRVGYYLPSGVFRTLKSVNIQIEEKKLNAMPRRKIIHFYINHFDHAYKERSYDRGDMYGINALTDALTEDSLRMYSFALGQLVSFLVLDCKVLPFDVEVVLGTSEKDRKVSLYVLDFNESQFINDDFGLDIAASEAARSLYSKDGKHYYPNDKNVYYNDFVNGLYDQRTDVQKEFVDVMLDYYNDSF